MKASFLWIPVLAIAAWAQSAAPGAPAVPPGLPNLPDETVIATFEDGEKLTMGEFRRIFAILPPDNQQMALRDRRAFLHQFALMRKLTQMAAAQKLNEQSPTKETLAYYNMMVLSQAKINDVVNNSNVEPGEIVKYYDINKDKYKLVRVKTIYISFNNNPAATGVSGRKVLNEELAKAKADKLVADLRAGADFIKAVKEHSDDETSRNRDGDFATLRLSDNIPDAIKAAVFRLKQGELSDAVRQPNGFYVFRAEEVTIRPLSQAREEIYNTLKQESYTGWLKRTDGETKVVYNSEEFLGPAAPKK